MPRLDPPNPEIEDMNGVEQAIIETLWEAGLPAIRLKEHHFASPNWSKTKKALESGGYKYERIGAVDAHIVYTAYKEQEPEAGSIGNVKEYGGSTTSHTSSSSRTRSRSKRKKKQLPDKLEQHVLPAEA